MPRSLSPALERMLRRANPHVAEIVEVSVPDQGRVLHRAEDQFLASPPLVSMAPASSAVASPTGALTLASVDQLLVNQYVDNGAFNIPQEDGGDRYINTVAWRIDPAFSGCILSSVTTRMKFSPFAALTGKGVNVKLQIFRAAQVAGVLQRQVGSSIVETQLTQVSFAPLLAEPVLVRARDLLLSGAMDGAGFADVTFDLTPYRIQVDPTTTPPPGPGQTGDLPELYFSVQTDQTSAGNFVEWRYDTTSAQDIAGVGRVREVSWTRGDPANPTNVWKATESGRALTFRLAVEQYLPTSQVVYAVALDALPAATSTGRVAFTAGRPRDTAAVLELSTAGAGGPFAVVQNGDVVATAQLVYHLRLTLTASADRRRAPAVSELGLEFRERIDVSPEATVQPMSQEVSLPWLSASVGEGSVDIVRAGRRDYHDAGTELAVRGADTTMEVDVYLGSRHPGVSRADWLHVVRAPVSGRYPTATSERFSLLSVTKTLNRKIPARVESIDRVHTVTAATTTQVTVGEDLKGTSATGNEYDGAGYYLKVRKSTVPGLGVGTVFTIGGNTGRRALDFVGLPAVFAVGDELEVHSGIYVQPGLSWIDRDPADVWWELLTIHLSVSSDLIGRGAVGVTGRAGLPPRVTDRAPGDAVTQAQLRVTLKTTGAERGDELLDQLSFILGGATIELAGRIVFRQIYPLRDAAGRITVAPDPVAAVFDPRDYADLDTPTGREARITVLDAAYGVNTAGAVQAAPSTATFIDVDALAALKTQDVEGLGFSAVPDEIARWCYNAADAGLFLASQLAQQVLLVGSTGLRAWPWTLMEARPDLTIGDSVVLVTDQYTDFDPARKRAIRGWQAYPLTIVSASTDGRRFRGLLQGLAEVAAVTLRGGPGVGTDTDPLTARASLYDVEQTQTDTTVVIRFKRGSAVTEVWGAYAVVTATGSTSYDFGTLVAPNVTPLPVGATSFAVPRPGDGQVTLVQLEPRLSDLVAGPVVRIPITATPQVPHVELDDTETATTGTQWWKVTERGIPVTAVEVQTQIGTEPGSAFGAPTRGPGAASAVRGGVLGLGEYEHDITLDPDRQSWIMPRLTLSNGAPPIVLGPFAFDRDKNPNILTASAVGPSVVLSGDSDGKSWRVSDTAGTWLVEANGHLLTVDVTQPGTNAVPGFAPGAVVNLLVEYFSDVVGNVTGGSLVASRSLTATVADVAAFAPVVEVDDLETTTTGTQWWKLTERGLAIISVEVQTQVGISPVSAWVTPTRGPGAISVVRGGLLAPGEYEHDVPLDPTRLSWIAPRYALAGVAAPVVLGPFGFDRDKNPNLATPTLIGDRKLSILSDVDTKSIQVFEGEYPWTAGRWRATFDGLSGVVDVAVADVNGVAGLGSAASKLYTVVAYAAASGYVDGTTPRDTRTLTIAGPTATAAASVWDTVYLVAPFAPSSGTGPDTVTLQLKATAAPAGWTVKVYYGDELIATNAAPTTDITSSLSPALSAPPTVLTNYTYGTGYPATRAVGSQQVTAKLRVDLVTGGVVQDTRTVQATWNTP